MATAAGGVYSRRMQRLVRPLIVAGWLAAVGWLVAYEAAPGLFSRALHGYRALLAQAPLVSDAWMRILVHGRPAGFSHTLVESAGEPGRDEYRIENQTVLSLRILGETRRVTVRAESVLDGAYRLRSFDIELHSEPYRVHAEGRHLRGTRHEVTLRTPAGSDRLEIDIPEDAVLYTPMTEALLGTLQPGRRVRLRTFDPLSLSSAEVWLEGEGRETIRAEGRDTVAQRVRVEYRGMEIVSWVAPDGRLLRQETPFGWTLEASTAREAIDAARHGGDADDLLAASAVPCEGAIADPRACRRLRLRLTGGAGLAGLALASDRQRVLAADGESVELEIRAEAAARGGAPTDPAPYLAATTFVQAGDPAIVERARRIVADAATPRERADRLTDWVHRSVRKNPAVSLPSALDVLRTLEGDCNEHTYLFVALARAAGLPARILAGIVYNEGAFYYHAWPAVLVDGRWHEADPTFGQRTADAARVALTEGELEGQLRLLAVAGRLRAEVLERN